MRLQARAELERTLQDERANNAAEKQRLQGATAAAEHLAQQSTGQVSGTAAAWAWPWGVGPCCACTVACACVFQSKNQLQ